MYVLKPSRSQKNVMKNIIFDLDGVLYLGKTKIVGASSSVTKLQNYKLNTFFLTNNSTLDRQKIKEKLKSFKINAQISQIMCSSYATAHYIQKLNKNARVYVIGEDGLKKELTNAKLKVLDENDCKKTLADFLVVGLDRKFNYEKLEIAQKHIIANKKFIATNTDPQYPSHEGIKPGGGAMVKAVCATSSRSKNPDFVVGKPSAYMLKLLLGSKNAQDYILVGDRLDSDIMLANKMNMHSILVLSGITKKEDLKKSKIKPNAVLNSVKDLPNYIKSVFNQINHL